MGEERAGQGFMEDRRRWGSRMHERIKDAPGGRHVYRAVVAVVGVTVVVVGLILVPLPGPGWLMVFAGLAILASEFVWAQRLLDFARATLQRWTRWLMARPIWVRGVVSLVAAGFVAGAVYLVVRWRGGVELDPGRHPADVGPVVSSVLW